MFHQQDVTRNYRGSSDTDHLPEWKVPRHHCEHLNELFTADITSVRVTENLFVRQQALPFSRVVTAKSPALFDLIHSRPNRFTHFGCDQTTELSMFSFEDVSNSQQYSRSLSKGRVAKSVK